MLSRRPTIANGREEALLAGLTRMIPTQEIDRLKPG
jgi:hypothetical protein